MEFIVWRATGSEVAFIFNGFPEWERGGGDSTRCRFISESSSGPNTDVA